MACFHSVQFCSDTPEQYWNNDTSPAATRSEALVTERRTRSRPEGVKEHHMVTAQDMRVFALDCLRWSDETHNASQRELMVQIAKT